ncbi:SIR2 family protein [Geodermatophilus sp. FMUSA9-8]|uniref:SIR2 family protein n=1 Tax=Geodermatophilus sp. FMUSA9-8 TaxID=3120155 RepID=UPI0030080F10
MAAHVFVVPGTLNALHCDDVVVPTDHRGVGGVKAHFRAPLGWRNRDDVPDWARDRRLDDRHRYLQLDPAGPPGDGPARWLLHVGASSGSDVAWLRDGIRQVLIAIAGSGRRPSAIQRRVAIPVVGVGRGGFGQRRGAVIAALLEELQAAPDELDIVLVASNRSDYSALQAHRAAQASGRLEDALEHAAGVLAERARQGQLAVFMGAGTGVAAGLPSWGELLDRLAEALNVPGGAAALSRFGPLDAAEVLRKQAKAEASSGAVDGAGEKTLGDHVAAVLGRPQRYGLSHVLLASLDVDQVITTNFEDLYEKAVIAVSGRDVPVVLPDRYPAEDIREGRGWLLKLHGDAGRSKSIVLDRRSFVRYDATRRPLASVLQATLLTRHLLVVGASMTDDNVIRLVHEVASLNEDHGRPHEMGTLVTLEERPLAKTLWEPEFRILSLGKAAPTGETKEQAAERLAQAGRQLEILLDRVATLAARDAVQHLLDSRYRDLFVPEEDTEAERRTAESLASAADSIRAFLPRSTRHAEWRAVLDQLERWGARGAGAREEER